MSLVQAETGWVAHYPTDPNKFQFDDEVSSVFPGMARRSIPGYVEAHRLHASMLLPILDARAGCTIVDIGASRGHFIKEVCNQLQIDHVTGSARLKCIAVDQSPHMLRRLKTEMPWVTTLEGDASCLEDLSAPADIVCLFYVLQFIQSDIAKLKVLQWAHRNLRNGGVLLLGQKEKVPGDYSFMFSAEYYKFRLRNGYSPEEIAAKTEALKNSMWPSGADWLEDLCYMAGFTDYALTTKWLQFSTSMCIK